MKPKQNDDYNFAQHIFISVLCEQTLLFLLIFTNLLMFLSVMYHQVHMNKYSLP